MVLHFSVHLFLTKVAELNIPRNCSKEETNLMFEYLFSNRILDGWNFLSEDCVTCTALIEFKTCIAVNWNQKQKPKCCCIVYRDIRL